MSRARQVDALAIATAALAGLYAGDLGLESIMETLEPLLADWPTA